MNKKIYQIKTTITQDNETNTKIFNYLVGNTPIEALKNYLDKTTSAEITIVVDILPLLKSWDSPLN